MLNWFNPRVVVVVLSVMMLISVTRSPEPALQVRHGIATCITFFVLYTLAFVLPLRRAVPWTGLAELIAVLLAAWTATALAIISDATPLPLEIQMQHPTNWPRIAFLLAAGLAFYLFYRAATRGYEALEEFRVTGRRRF